LSELKNADYKFRVGIIGAGLQGKRRASVFKEHSESKLVMVSSKNIEDAENISKDFNCEASARWQDIIERDDINTVLICTPPNLHPEMAIAATNAGKHLLCEKPLANTLEEAQRMLESAKNNNVILKCGFNHRHHPAVFKAKELVNEGTISEINFIRCVYGICGRPGYEKEWRADSNIVGGGHLTEQGIHAIDLFRWFLGDFNRISGHIATNFWQTASLEDNAFVILETEKGQIASLHSSLTQWKNQFLFEIFGKNGYIIIEGLGGAYGTEKLTVGKRNFYGPFKDETTEFRGADISWAKEWEEFTSAIKEKREPIGSGDDGFAALKIVSTIYKIALKGKQFQI